MQFFTTLVALALTNVAFAAPVPRQGTSVITQPCQSDAECDTGCCGFTSGKCSGVLVASTRDGGCGFGNPFPNRKAIVAVPQNVISARQSEPVAAFDLPGKPLQITQLPKSLGTSVITQACKADAECDTGCCGFTSGKCSGVLVAQARDGGCGFGTPTPNKGGALNNPVAQVARQEATQTPIVLPDTGPTGAPLPEPSATPTSAPQVSRVAVLARQDASPRPTVASPTPAPQPTVGTVGSPLPGTPATISSILQATPVAVLARQDSGPGEAKQAGEKNSTPDGSSPDGSTSSPGGSSPAGSPSTPGGSSPAAPGSPAL